jgi:hypothetical protein
LSDAVYQNPAGVHEEFRDRLDQLDTQGLDISNPEDWAFIEAERLAGLLARRGDRAAIAELRDRADIGDPAAAKPRAELLARWDDQEGPVQV